MAIKVCDKPAYTEENTCQNTNVKEHLEDNDGIHKNDLTPQEPSPHNPIAVKILQIEEYNTDKQNHDAELYRGNHTHHIEQQPSRSQNIIADIDTISSQEIEAIIHHLRTQRTNERTFTTNDLNRHIYDQNRVSMQISIQQVDSGANRSVTNDKNILQQYRNIKTIPVYGVRDQGAACFLKGQGYLNLQDDNGEWIQTLVYYSPECTGTILSPNAIVKNDPSLTSWNQTSHMDQNKATIYLYNKNAINRNLTFTLHGKNDLWFIRQPFAQVLQKATRHHVRAEYVDTPRVNRLSKTVEHELWHQRLIHPGDSIMKHIHQTVDGVPKLTKHPFHKCNTCDDMKVKKQLNAKGESAPTTRPGQRFHMDFGFVRGKKKHISVRSHDGYRSYLLIIDHYSRYGWIFLSKNKQPPLATIKYFLSSYGINDNTVKVIRTDQGGELARSKEFRKVVEAASYSIETTGADNSSQNGIVERPHQTLANMMRTCLEDANLGPEYWSDAILHCLFVKNRLPHKAFAYKSTPYEKLCGKKPNLSTLKVFGSRVVARQTGKRPSKLSKHAFNGIFLRYAKTMRNIVYLDIKTKRIKTATHVLFDEAHYCFENKPPGAKRLVQLGLEEMASMTDDIQNKDGLTVIKAHQDAQTPIRATSDSAGYDLYSTNDHSIPPGHIDIIDTGIKIKLPPGVYGRIASRSGLVVRHKVEVKAGVIDPDFTGTIKVILHNFGDTTFDIKKGDRIAQLIMESYKAGTTTTTSKPLEPTDRGEGEFGSTGTRSSTMDKTPPSTQVKTLTTKVPHTPNKTEEIETSTLNASDLELCWNEPLFTTTIKISNKGGHKTRGLTLSNKHGHVIIEGCEKGTPAARIYNWRRTLRHARLIDINGIPIHSIKQVIKIFQTMRKNVAEITMTVATNTPEDINPDTGLPQLSFDQFNIIAAHHQHILYANKQYMEIEEAPPLNNSVITKLESQRNQKLTRKRLQQRDDWSDWKASEWLQLDQYHKQGMFSDPGPLPDNDNEDVNVLPMIWTYLIKSCGRKKARCVANGAPHLQGSITMAHTYAACLEQAGCRLFWAIAALKNKVVYGSDASNAFAEAPPPKAPLYLKVDAAYKEWYES